jgi:excisionase family DNA binding protein
MFVRLAIQRQYVTADYNRQRRIAAEDSELYMPTTAERPPLRSLPTAAKAMGVTVACLRSWIYKRKIAYTKIGRAVRISDDTIQRIIDRGTVPAREE